MRRPHSNYAKIAFVFGFNCWQIEWINGAIVVGITLRSIPMAILPDLTAKSHDELLAIIHALAASKSSGKLTLKVSEKGAISIYGLGRFPITLYKSQFDKLNEAWPEVQAFAKANAAMLTTKA